MFVSYNRLLDHLAVGVVLLVVSTSVWTSQMKGVGANESSIMNLASALFCLSGMSPGAHWLLHKADGPGREAQL